MYCMRSVSADAVAAPSGRMGWVVLQLDDPSVAGDLVTFLNARPDWRVPVRGRARLGATHHGLTPRELDILVAVSSRLSNRAIGSELFVSDQTVKFHLNWIYKKLGSDEPHGSCGAGAPARARPGSGTRRLSL